jgi:preprotein translocase SecF subunit
MQFFRNTNINFVGAMRPAFILSVLLILAGVVSLVSRGGPHLSIDFTGGTMLQVRCDPRPAIADLRGALDAAGFERTQVQAFGEQDFLITLPGLLQAGAPVAGAAAGAETAAEGEAAAGAAAAGSTVADEGDYTAEVLLNALRERLPGTTVTQERVETVGPKIGGELRTAAMNSIVAALVLIVLYITVRFVFRYGIAAIMALVHDVSITLGVFSLLDKEISLSIIAAFMTIIGYSLNDTIVVFDRIRENMRLRRRESYREVINRSINECLSRTVLTSLTTFFVAAVLFALGGPVIHDFAFALCFGVIIGTYSSIFIASPILVWWTERRILDRKRAQPAM